MNIPVSENCLLIEYWIRVLISLLKVRLPFYVSDWLYAQHTLGSGEREWILSCYTSCDLRSDPAKLLMNHPI